MNAPTGNGPDGTGRLAPEMASFRLLVLAFVREYVQEHEGSPSYGEIGAALHCSRTRAREAAKSLARDGLLIRTPGPRGLKLPSVREQAIRQLRELGWCVDEDTNTAAPFERADSTLLPPLRLRYPDPRSDVRRDKDGEQAAQPGSTRAR